MSNESQVNKMRWQEIADVRCAIDSQKLQNEFKLSIEQLNKLLDMCLDFECKIIEDRTFNCREFEESLKQEFGFDYVQITEILLIFVKGWRFERLAYVYTRLSSNDERLMQSGARVWILNRYNTLLKRAERESEIKRIVDEMVKNSIWGREIK